MFELAKEKCLSETIISKKDAVQYFNEKGDEYKLELLEGLEDGQITFYTQGQFNDLCRGPHIPTLPISKRSNLMSLAGALLAGDEKRKQLTVFMVSLFPKQKIDVILFRTPVVQKRDHRKPWLRAGTIMFSEKVGQRIASSGFPKGTTS